MVENGRKGRWGLNGTCQVARLISERLVSEIIECDELMMVKLYSSGVSREQVEEEVRLTDIARRCGIRVPLVNELVEDSGRWGFSYRKIEGYTYLDLMVGKARDVDEIAASMALAHRDIYERRGEPGMPALKDRARATIEGCGKWDDLRNMALEALDPLPDGDQMCHGDLHPGNVIVTDEGNFILDWADASSGHYLADVARSLVLIVAWLPGQLERMGGEATPDDLRRFYLSYRRHAFISTSEAEALLERWTFPVAVARLCQGVPGEEARLLEMIEGCGR